MTEQHSILNYQLSIPQAVPYINWLYFFHAWGFPARYASIAQQHDCMACRQTWLAQFNATERPRAEEALRLYTDATALLRRHDSRQVLSVRYAIMEAYSHGDDIIVTDSHGHAITLPMLRQQHGAFQCLADYVNPVYTHGEHTSQIGIFCATAGKHLETMHAESDSYNHLLAQTLADRLAEAVTEAAHEHIRRHVWAYAPDEHLTLHELHAEHYQGIRPAVGYPCLPDQSINFLLDQLIDFSAIGIALTTNGAMQPHASVSGLMLSHPDACYFGVGTIGNDQLTDYAQRRGLPTERMRTFLASNIGN